jgi:hypothetical protein
VKCYKVFVEKPSWVRPRGGTRENNIKMGLEELRREDVS